MNLFRHGSSLLLAVILATVGSACKPATEAGVKDAVTNSVDASQRRVFFYKRFNGGNPMLCMAECSPNAPQITNYVQIRSYCKFNRRGMSLKEFRTEKIVKDYPNVASIAMTVDALVPDPKSLEDEAKNLNSMGFNRPPQPLSEQAIAEGCRELPEIKDTSCGGDRADQLSDAPENQAPAGETACALITKKS
jgi:hypothetical protein